VVNTIQTHSISPGLITFASSRLTPSARFS
jgi:hypothetical protein